jgi:LacI family repressor for deo operon, udp, cdd, tsx, nupC, and nupG
MDLLNLISIDARHDTSLAFQIKQQITWWVINGSLKPGERLPTVRQMAKHLGINLHTVRSAYLKLEADGLVETRRGRGTHVLAFDPQRIAQPASVLRSHTVGVILPSFSNPFYHAFLKGVEEVAEEDQTMLFVCDTHDDPNNTWRHYTRLAAKQVDGILVVSDDIHTFLTPQVVQAGPPLVSVDWPGAAGYSVQFDLESAGWRATRHLLEHGHRQIGLLTFALDMANTFPVNAGYRRALVEAGILFDSELVARVPNFDMASGAEGARQLLALAQPPSAIFAIADMLALGAMRAIKAAGLHIPNDIALVGFNDIAMAELVDPSLTTVAAPASQGGRAAMSMLRDLVAGKQPARQQIMLPTHLVVRQSCGHHDKPGGG